MSDHLVGRLRATASWGYDLPADAANRIEALEAALKLAIEMRAHQKAYFKDRTKDALIDSKMAEAAFDRAALGARK